MGRLYRVRLAQSELWGTYKGSVNDVLEIDIFEFWLMEA